VVLKTERKQSTWPALLVENVYGWKVSGGKLQSWSNSPCIKRDMRPTFEQRRVKQLRVRGVDSACVCLHHQFMLKSVDVYGGINDFPKSSHALCQ
jgi:hypothetical protein